MATAWDATIERAIHTGLSTPTQKAPPTSSLTPLLDAAFEADSPAFFPSPRAGGGGAIGTARHDYEEDDDDAVHSQLIGHMHALREHVQTAVGRSKALLRDGGARTVEAWRIALRADIEAWVLDAVRIEATVEEALRGAVAHLSAREAAAAQDRSELAACRRALEVNVAQGTRNAQDSAMRAEQAERQREEEVAVLSAHLAQAQAEVAQLSEQHGRRLHEVQEEVRRASDAEGAATARQQAAEVAEARSAREEAVQQLAARSRLLEAAAEREEGARSAWADERVEWQQARASTHHSSAARFRPRRPSACLEPVPAALALPRSPRAALTRPPPLSSLRLAGGGARGGGGGRAARGVACGALGIAATDRGRADRGGEERRARGGRGRPRHCRRSEPRGERRGVARQGVHRRERRARQRPRATTRG